MKKSLTAIFMTATVLSMTAVTASAEEAAINVYVTIADDKGQLALAQQKITVSDLNGDGSFSIDEALFAAHEAGYNGGAAAGYSAYDGDYGRSLGMLWGVDNGGAYGYYVNNASAISLADEVKEGDYINAFCYTDLTTWSDTYCFFDKNTAEGGEFTLTLSAAGWDESYNPITVPVEGAVITIDGEKTEFVTDSEGKAAITIDNKGSCVISAVSDSQTLVPPVCIAAAAEAETEGGEVDAAGNEATVSNPTTGVSLSLAGLAAAAGAMLISRKRK